MLRAAIYCFAALTVLGLAPVEDRSLDFAFSQGTLPANGGIIRFPSLGYFNAVMDLPAVHHRLRFRARISDFNELIEAVPRLSVPCGGDFSQSLVLVFDDDASASAFPAVRIWNPYLHSGDIWNAYLIDDTAPGKILLALRRSATPQVNTLGLRFPSIAGRWTISSKHRYVWLFCPAT